SEIGAGQYAARSDLAAISFTSPPRQRNLEVANDALPSWRWGRLSEAVLFRVGPTTSPAPHAGVGASAPLVREIPDYILGAHVDCGRQSSVPRLCRRFPKLADRHNDAQPGIGAIVVALAAHLLHHLARIRGRFVAMKLDEQMGRAG